MDRLYFDISILKICMAVTAKKNSCNTRRAISLVFWPRKHTRKKLWSERNVISRDLGGHSEWCHMANSRWRETADSKKNCEENCLNCIRHCTRKCKHSDDHTHVWLCTCMGLENWRIQGGLFNVYNIKRTICRHGWLIIPFILTEYYHISIILSNRLYRYHCVNFVVAC